VRLAVEQEPTIAVVDIGMPGLNGIEATTQLVRDNPRIGVVMLSMHADESYVTRALNAGARGYVLKDTADDEIEAAVLAVAAGRTYFSERIAKTLLEDYVRMMRDRGVSDSYELLSEREREVVQLIAEGKSNKEVAVVLDVSPHTVETHRSKLMQKLNLHSTAEIVLYAVRKGIITP
jgi:DNA-binding NarL/FixJ family response regulator